ncbi:MAG: NADH-quinone oxidoreductase subunit NuoE [Alphaproteobacteria bacterium]
MSFEFTGDYLVEAKRNIAKYPDGRQQSAVLALLFLAQQQNHAGGNHVTEEAMRTISQMLEMPYIRVMEVATFFTQINLSPIGKYHLQLCGTTPCMLRGAEAIKQKIMDKLDIDDGETSADGMFTLTEVECLGACCNAPMVQINDDYFEDLTPEIMEALLDKLAAGDAVTPGPQNSRKYSEPQSGQKTLLAAKP